MHKTLFDLYINEIATLKKEKEKIKQDILNNSLLLLNNRLFKVAKKYSKNKRFLKWLQILEKKRKKIEHDELKKKHSSFFHYADDIAQLIALNDQIQLLNEMIRYITIN